jgi:hypothetical protein
VAKLILPDSSAWIEFLRNTGSPVNVAMRELIEGGARLVITGPVAMELEAGERAPEALERVRATLAAFPELSVNASDWPQAANLFRACTQSGRQVSDQLDCLIAAIAIRNKAEVLTADRDFAVIAAVSTLRLHATG